MSRTKSASTTSPEPDPVSQAAPESTEEPVTLTGRLAADPILRHTQNGVPVSTFRIAVNHDDGAATFHSVVAWKRTAEVVAQYLRKGRLVEVIGRERSRTWSDNEGVERTSVELNAFRVQFLSRSQPVAQPAQAAEQQQVA